MDIPLIGFAPDLDPAKSGVFVACAGYEPTPRGWRLQRTTSVVASATPAATTLIAGGVGTTVAGQTVVHLSLYDGVLFSKLYRYDGSTGSTLTDATRASGGSYSGGAFSFSQFGNYTLATNRLDVVQIRDSSTSAAFADSAATGIPKADIGFTWGPPTAQRTMFLSYNDGVNYLQDSWWSGNKGGPTADWTASNATESVNGRLLGAGSLTCGIGYRDTAVAFSADQTWVGTYTGPPFVVGWSRVANNVGCIGKYAACTLNGVLYWVGQQGLYAFDGSYPQLVDVPIQRWLTDLLNGGTLSNAFSTLVADQVGQRLILCLRTSSWNTAYAISIHVPTRKIGYLTFLNNLFMLDSKYRLSSNGATVQLLRESTLPITTTGNYIQLLLGGEPLSLVKRIWPRFVTAPTSVGLDYAHTMAMSDAQTFNSAGTAVSTSPWRFDLLQASRWHGLRLYTNSNGTNDPELVGLSADVIPQGR